jgi:aspartyl-tRNA(Asn)/glutamyl-tRNA(Gln) amidotransferase subunit C
MPLLKEQIRQAARLARIKLNPSEIGKLALELPSVFDYFDQISEIPTDSVSLKSRAAGTKAALREDEAGPSLPSDQAVGNAPKRIGDFFVVPKVVDR